MVFECANYEPEKITWGPKGPVYVSQVGDPKTADEKDIAHYHDSKVLHAHIAHPEI